MYIKQKKYNPDIQIFAMRNKYPQFSGKVLGNSIVFKGNLQAKPELPIYTVTIEYRGIFEPVVKVVNPKLVENPPHTYPDKRLCLYHPANFKWKKEKLVANEIIEWTASWIYFYEVWLETSIWYGPEAPHNIKKE